MAPGGKSGTVGRQGDDEEGTSRERGASFDRSSRTATPRDPRESLVVAANELFGEVGYDSAKTGDIAARANVAQATLFRHFETKADLALFHLRAGVEQRRRPRCWRCPRRRRHTRRSSR